MRVARGLFLVVALHLDDAARGFPVAHRPPEDVAGDVVDRALVEGSPERGRHAAASSSARRARPSCSSTRRSDVPPSDTLDSIQPRSRSSSRSSGPTAGGELRQLGIGQVRERGPPVEGVSDEARDHAMGLAKGDALAYEHVGNVGGSEQLVCRGRGHPVAAAT